MFSCKVDLDFQKDIPKPNKEEEFDTKDPYEEIETDQYLKLFDRVMRKENDTNVEFLEKSIEEVVGRRSCLL